MGDSNLVLVTGATGYIATHCIKVLQDAGWRVRGTVRNLKDERKTSALYAIAPDAKFKLELVEADLVKADTWPAAVEGCTYVLHVASPCPGSGAKCRDVEAELLRPAVDGTLNVLRACAGTRGAVRRVVVTSSVVAVFGDTRHAGGATDRGREYDEQDWTNGDDPTLDMYVVSKVRAERAAWDFVGRLRGEERFELCTVCPSYVGGPFLTRINTEAPSLEVMTLLMNRDVRLIPGTFRFSLPVCDVRDVAETHLKAMLLTNAAGGRFIVYSESVWMIDICRILRKHFGRYGYKFPSRELPKPVLWFGRFFDVNFRHAVYPRLGLWVEFDNSKTRDILGVAPRKAEETFVDMARSMINMGYCRKLSKFPAVETGGGGVGENGIKSGK